METTEVPAVEAAPVEEAAPETTEAEAPAEPEAAPEAEMPNADQLFEAIQQDAKGEDEE